MKYKKRPTTIEATQWFKNGDHPNDGDKHTEGKVVRYFRRPDILGKEICEACNCSYYDHGWIDTLEGGHIVCPGDFIITKIIAGIITGTQKVNYPCKPEIFHETYIRYIDE